jgi:uncharacterized protein (DUF983 family)
MCGYDAVFNGFYSMNRECEKCGLVFEKEPGYFMGAVFAGYIFTFFSLIPTLIVSLFFFEASLLQICGLGILQIALLHPVLFHRARLMWFYIDHKRRS